MKKSELFFAGILVPIDLIMIFVSALLAYGLRFTNLAQKLVGPVIFDLPLKSYIILILGISIIWLFIFALTGLYCIRPKLKWPEETSKIIIACSAGMGLIMTIIVFSGQMFESRFIILIGWILSIVFTIFGRSILRITQKWIMAHSNWGTHNLLLIGKNNTAQRINRFIKIHPSLGYRVIAQMPKFQISKAYKFLKKRGIDEIVQSDPGPTQNHLLSLINFCEEERIILKFIPGLTQALSSNIELEMLGRFPVIEIKKTRLDGWGAIFKRCVDVVFSIIAILVLSPLFLGIAVLIKWDSSGPVFVKLMRISQSRKFGFYKFRSMIDQAWKYKKELMKYNERQDGPLFKMQNDPRITRIGRFLRKTRFDEFPQLLNVLKGEMSLIGPRPHEPEEIAKYAKHHKKLLFIKPGMSGMPQISGGHKLSFEEEVRLDTYYIENWSPFLDLQIFLRTLVFLVRDRTGC